VHLGENQASKMYAVHAGLAGQLDLVTYDHANMFTMSVYISDAVAEWLDIVL